MLAQTGEYFEGTSAGLVEVFQPLVAVKILGDVVNPHDVQAIGLQACQAVFNGAQGGVGAVVIDYFIGAAVFEYAAFFAKVTGGFFDFIENHAADLGAEHVVIAVIVGQRLAQADFRQARAVERRGIEVTHALAPGGLDGGLGFFFGDSAKHIAQGGGAKAQYAGQCVFQAHGGSSIGARSL